MKLSLCVREVLFSIRKVENADNVHRFCIIHFGGVGGLAGLFVEKK